MRAPGLCMRAITVGLYQLGLRRTPALALAVRVTGISMVRAREALRQE